MILHAWTDDDTNLSPVSKYIRPLRLVKCSRWESPEAAARYAVGIMGDGDILFLRHYGEYTAGIPNLGSESLADFVGGRTPSFVAWTAWSDRFWAEYAAHGGIQPYRVVLEHERGYTWYRIGLDNTTRCNAIETAMAEPKGFSSSIKKTYNRATMEAVVGAGSAGARWVVDFSDWIQSWYTKRLYDSVASGYFKMGYTGNIFSNYGVARGTVETREINNWPSGPAKYSTGFGYHSPALYMNTNGNRGMLMNRYNNLVSTGKETDAVTELASASSVAYRLCLQTLNSIPKTNRLPWIGKTRYRGDNVPPFQTPNPAIALLQAMIIGGVKDALYWVGRTESIDERNEMVAAIEEAHARAGSGLKVNVYPDHTYPEYSNTVRIADIDFR